MPMPQILLLAFGLLGLLGLLAAGMTVAWWRTHHRRLARGGATPSKSDALALFALRGEPLRALGERQARTLATLTQALPTHVVLARVPLSHFIRVAEPQMPAWSSLVGPLEADLLVCDSQGRPLLAIELLPAQEPSKASQLRRQQLRVIESAQVATLSVGPLDDLHILAARLQSTLGRAGGQAKPAPSPASAASGKPADGAALSTVIPVAEVLELSPEDLPEFAPTTIFRPDDAVLPPRL